MLTVYGATALRAWELVTTQRMSPPTAWRTAVCERYTDAKQRRNALKQTCPRGAFLALCGRGFVRDVVPRRYTSSTRSSQYAVTVAELLRSEPELADNKSVLEHRVFGSRAPNDEGNVVLALRTRGLLTR